MIFQTTLNRTLTITGIGLHTGRQITMILRPAESGAGIVFHRVDGERRVSIEAVSANVVDTRLATVIGKGGVSVSTIEHLMAALSACGIDNLHVDINGPEVPIMDGSAAPFVALLRQVGLRALNHRRKYLAIRKPVTVVDGEKRVSIIPSRFFRITYDIAFDHPCIGLQHRAAKINGETFRRDIAAARTFGFLHEVEYLKANGLALGGSLDNAVVLDEDGILNPGGARFEDECVRHKILDLIGDIYLCGRRVKANIIAIKPGHYFNVQLANAMLKQI